MKRALHISFIMLAFTGVYTLYPERICAQQKVKTTLKDSLDGAFDLSNYMIYSNGFIAVPTIITEPSLGGIGGALIPLFLKKRPVYTDTINGNVRHTRVNPDITGALGMYTANKSWMAIAFRAGTFAKARITYRVAAGYGSINLGFYKTLPQIGEKEFDFNFKIIPAYVQALKQFGNAKWSAGLQYLFISTKLSATNDSLPDFVKDYEINSITSQLGAIIQYDGRDNIFTPDNGVRVQADFLWSDNVIGSDYDSWRINYSMIGYVPVVKKLISGLRIEGQQSLGSPPFYLLPSINLRGVPAARYQGQATLLAELENRWDFYRRWSILFYGGLGFAYDDWGNMFENPTVYSYGTGFRYLLARKFKLRMGVDVARGPKKWAYYVVFGSNWFR